MAHGRKLVIAMPYIWLILLFLLPFLIVFKISLAEMARAIPPYTNLMDWADGQLTLTLNLGNFLQLTDDPLYLKPICSHCRWRRSRRSAVCCWGIRWRGRWRTVSHRRVIFCCCW
jgi:putrescine transport system permease protein